MPQSQRLMQNRMLPAHSAFFTLSIHVQIVEIVAPTRRQRHIAFGGRSYAAHNSPLFVAIICQWETIFAV
jgi:hypothetical protein